MMLFWLISFVECQPEDVVGVLLFYNTDGIRSVSMPNFRGGIPIFDWYTNLLRHASCGGGSASDPPLPKTYQINSET